MRQREEEQGAGVLCVDDLVQLVKDDFAAIIGAIRGAIPLAAQAAEELGRGVFNAIWTGLGDLWQLGADIVHWILQGLKDMAWQLWDWAEGMAKGLADKLNPKNIIGSVTGGIGNVAGGVFNQVGGGGGGEVSSPGGMGNPSVNYQDPRGVTLTADDIYRMKQDPNFGFVGLPAPIVVNIDTVNAQTEADARTAAGTIAYSLATAGMVA